MVKKIEKIKKAGWVGGGGEGSINIYLSSDVEILLHDVFSSLIAINVMVGDILRKNGLRRTHLLEVMATFMHFIVFPVGKVCPVLIKERAIWTTIAVVQFTKTLLIPSKKIILWIRILVTVMQRLR